MNILCVLLPALAMCLRWGIRGRGETAWAGGGDGRAPVPRQLLVSCLLLGWAIFPHLPQQVSLALRARSVQEQQVEMRRLLARDPKPGQTMPDISHDLLGRPLPQAARRRVVLVGMVTERNLARVTAWLRKETSHSSAKWVLVGIGKREELRKLQEHLGTRLRMVLDTDGKRTVNGTRCRCRACTR